MFAQGQPSERVCMCLTDTRKTLPPIQNSRSHKGVEMDITVFTQLIGNVGVPVACLCAMFYLWNRETEAHKEEMNNLTKALNDNTLVIQKLLDKLESDGK